ncbi:MAG: hypothetical protein HY746_06450 [Elusimicrobia bacterium]|nr:hypothetical protein [Elusimicrobiota bacterium]
MDRNAIITAIFSVAIFVASVPDAEGGTIENLTETSAKISQIDMDKNLDEAGKVLDSFYTGTEGKGESFLPVKRAAIKRPWRI